MAKFRQPLASWLRNAGVCGSHLESRTVVIVRKTAASLYQTSFYINDMYVNILLVLMYPGIWAAHPYAMLVLRLVGFLGCSLERAPVPIAAQAD